MGVHGFHVPPWGEPFPAVSCEQRRGVLTRHLAAGQPPQLLAGRARDSPAGWAGGLLFLLAFFFPPVAFRGAEQQLCSTPKAAAALAAGEQLL